MKQAAAKSRSSKVLTSGQGQPSQTGAAQGLLDSAPLIAYSIDRNFIYTAFNCRHAELVLANYGARIQVGDNFLEALGNSPEAGQARNIMAGLLAGVLRDEQLANRITSSSGSTYRSRVMPLRDAQGLLLGVNVFTEDITELTGTETALRESQAKFSKLFLASPTAICLTSLAEGRFIEVNDAYVNLMGWPREELIGHTSLELGMWVDPQLRQPELVNLVKHGVFHDHGVNLRTKSGRLLTIRLAGGLVTIKDETCALVSMEDITAQKQAEEAIRQERALLRTVIDSLPDAVYLKDIQGRKTLANRVDLQNIGVTSEDEVLGKTDWEVFQKEAALNATADDQTVLQSGQPILNHEELLTNLRGEQHWLLTSKMPYRDEKGQITGILGIGRDISERKQMEQALRESEAKYRLLTESIQDVVWVMDPATMRFNYVSPSVFNLRGFTPAEIMAEPVTAGLSPVVVESIRQATRQRIADFKAGKITSSTFFNEEVKQQRKDGSTVWVEVVTNYYVNPGSGRVEILGVMHDISRRKQMELAIHQRVKELTCLSSVSELLDNETIQQDELCAQTAACLAPAMQFPGLSSAAIEMAGISYLAGKLPDDLSTCLSAPITQQGRDFGRVSVYYGQPEAFLPEERDLVNNIARLLGLWLERRRAAAEVHKLTQAVEQSPLNIFITDLDWKIMYANPAFMTVTGYSQAEIIGKLPGDLIRSDSTKPDIDLEIAAALTSGQVWHGEFIDRTKDGNTFWEAASLSPLRDENGNTLGYLAIEQDITQQKADQQRIAEALELNQTMQQASPIGILIFKAGGQCIAANPAAGAIIGADPATLLKDDFRKIKTWLANGLTQSAIQSLESGQKTPVQVKYTTLFGRDVELKGSFVPFTAAGEADLLFMFEDVTERELAESQLKDSQEKYRSLFEESPIMIWEEDFSAVQKEFKTLRAQGVQDFRAYFESQPQEVRRLVSLVKVIDVNSENMIFFGGRDKADVMQGMGSLLVDESWPYFTEELIALAQGANTFETEMPSLTLSGERKHTFLRLSVASSQRESLAQVIVSIMDITARKQAEAALQAATAELEARVQARTAELQAANLALEKAARAKDEFLATMSHELRTPLTGILGLSQALEMQLKNVLTDKQMNVLQTIEKSGQRLHELINDVLDYSRLQSGEVQLQRGSFALERTFQTGLQECKRLAFEKHQRLEVRLEPEGLTLISDERRVKQIISNLVNNAIKFTPPGGQIELSASAHPELREVQISVRDNGIGIQPEDMERLFQPFTQLDARLAREYGGTGLGLALVKRLAELLDGRVTVESTPGQGSCFSLFLPWNS